MAGIFDLFKRIEKKSEPTLPVSFVVVGLGNPGTKYENTRHNAGFMVLDSMTEKLGVKVDRAKFHALYGDAVVGGTRVLFVKPQTFMNSSGISVREVANYYKIPADHILIISDDITLPVGRMRLRKNGSAGGHNGLKSIIEELGSDAFPRLRIGVGEKPHPDYPLIDWVLSKFTDDEIKTLSSEYGVAKEGIETVISGDIDKAIALCNANRA